MNRRGFLAAACTTALAAQVRAAEQARGKVFRVLMTAGGTNPRSASFYVAFERRLRELGWVDGKNIVVEFADDTKRPLAAEIKGAVERGVDVIMVPGPDDALKFAVAATRTIPIVMVALNYDPVEKGYVKSLARPGGNITGVFFRNGEVGAKQLELLRTAIPSATRVGVLSSKYSTDQMRAVEAAASRLGMQLDKADLSGPYDIGQTLSGMKARHVDAVLVVGDPITFRDRVRIVESALAQRLPTVGGIYLAQAGSLIGFGPNLDAALQTAAEYVDKILRGAAPAELPIEQPTKFGLVINQKTARALGLVLPQALLVRADEVIQ
jgi:putative ABC transport system substrate-binding protein